MFVFTLFHNINIVYLSLLHLLQTWCMLVLLFWAGQSAEYLAVSQPQTLPQPSFSHPSTPSGLLFALCRAHCLWPADWTRRVEALFSAHHHSLCTQLYHIRAGKNEVTWKSHDHSWNHGNWESQPHAVFWYPQSNFWCGSQCDPTGKLWHHIVSQMWCNHQVIDGS